MKRELIALIMVIVMVTSICTVAATTVTAATATTFSITTSTASPQIYEKYTITGALKAGTTALTNKPVHLESHTKNAAGTWSAWADVAGTYKYTNSSGKVSSTRQVSTPGVREYRWHYNGTSTYAAARSSAVTVDVQKIKMALSFYTYAHQVSANVGAQVTFTVYLNEWNTTQGKWVPSVGRNVRIYHDATFLDSGQTLRFNDPTVTTGAGGSKQFTLTMGTEPTKRTYYAVYDGDSTRAKSGPRSTYDGAITVKWGTKLTLSASSLDLSCRNTLWLYAQLKDQNGNALVGATVTLRNSNGGSLTGTTGTDGRVTFTIPGTPSGVACIGGSTDFTAKFGGDVSDWSSTSNTVTVHTY